MLTAPPETLLEALRLFYLGVAAHSCERDEEKPYNRSMMVHPSQQTTQHNDFCQWVHSTKRNWLKALAKPSDDPLKHKVLQEFQAAYRVLAETAQQLPSFEQLVRYLEFGIRETVVTELNTRAQARTPNVNWKQDPYHILVGGQALDRGYTVEGLTVTYMPRGKGVGNADTLQQRARWFGYKSDYLGYCRVYLSSESMQAFEHYVEHEEHMRAQMRKCQEEGLQLTEWKRFFFMDRSMRPTRQSVLSLDYVRGGQTTDWYWPRAPHYPAEAVERNKKVVTDFLGALHLVQDAGSEERSGDERHLVDGQVPLQRAFDDLLIPLSVGLPRDEAWLTGVRVQVRRYLDDNPGAIAAVFVMSRGEPRERTLSGHDAGDPDSPGEIKQLLQGPSPDRYGARYKGDRAMKAKDSITIQIHTLELLNDSKQVVATDVPAIAVCLPRRLSQGWISQPQGGSGWLRCRTYMRR